MFSKLFSFFSLKRKFSSTEETNSHVDDDSNGRPTKRVRIEEPSSSHEDKPEQHSPVQDTCTINDEEEEEELEVWNETLPRETKGKEVERVEETRAIAARLREETRNHVDSLDRIAGHPSPTPHPPQLQWLSLPRPVRLDEFTLGLYTSPPSPSIPIFVFRAPLQMRPSNSSRSTSHSPTSPLISPPSHDCSSTATILASLRRLRQQFNQAPEEEVQELGEDDNESGDEDLPLFTAMMQVGNPPPPDPEYQRDYPVYVEDLVLPDDLRQVVEVDMRVIIYLDEDGESVDPFVYRRDRGLPLRVEEDEEDEESPEERLERLVREGEAEDLE